MRWLWGKRSLVRAIVELAQPRQWQSSSKNWWLQLPEDILVYKVEAVELNAPQRPNVERAEYLIIVDGASGH